MTDSGSVVTTMPVAPAYANGGSGFGGWGNDIWLIIIILFAFGGFGGWGAGNNGGTGSMYPWMNNLNAMQSGFDTAALTSQLSGIQTSLTNGFANAEVAGCNRAMDALSAAYNNQIASMNQSFANQQAVNQGFNNIQSQLASCCCENRLSTANLGADIAREACADRQAVSTGVRDILENQNQGIQRILDQMCSDKIDAKNEKIADLERQLSMASLAASQATQTSSLIENNTLQTQYLINRIAPYPVPSYSVMPPYSPVASV